MGSHERFAFDTRHDGLFAATAKMNDLVLVTRKDADVAGLGAKLLNPFNEGAAER